MNDLLKDYSQQEIEGLAIKQLENNNFEENIPIKIKKIDTEYKRHNKKAITKAILNGSIILLCASIVLNSDSNISNFGTEDLTNIFDNIVQTVSTLPKSDVLVAVYTKMFDGINFIIDKIGLMGIILATKSIKFVLSTVKDTKKTLKMKKELLDLKQSIEEKNITSNYTR